MSGDLMIDNIVINIFSDTLEQEMNSMINKYFSKIKDDAIYLYQGYLRDYTWKKQILIQITHCVPIISWEGNYGNILVVCYL